MHNPSVHHLTAVMRILRYLKKAPGQGLCFKKTNTQNLTVFTDADWGGSPSDMRSTTGYATFLWGNLVTWRSKKQPVVARSSAEAELRALALGLCEGLWIKRVMNDLGLTITLPIHLYCDNVSAIHMIENPIQHDKSKHIEIDRHFIREKIEDNVICITHVASKNQTADIFTKPLAVTIFYELLSKLGCINPYNQLEGEC